MWTSDPVEPDCVDCSPPFSFYLHFVSRHWKYGSPKAFHRLCTLARKLGALRVVVLPADQRHDVVEELDHLDDSLGGGGGVHAVEFTFFAADVSLDMLRARGGEISSPIGQAVLINYSPSGDDSPVSYIHEAIFSKPRVDGPALNSGVVPDEPEASGGSHLLNHYYHIQREFEVACASRTWQIEGVYYCQQNTYTSVCAHACLRMAINSMRLETGPRDLISNKWINEELQLSPPVYGLSQRQITDVLGRLGLVPSVWELDSDSSISARMRSTLDGMAKRAGDLLRQALRRSRHPEAAIHVRHDGLVYSVVESGFPALLVFSTGHHGEDHVVTVYGHTLNSDAWHPQASLEYAGPEGARYHPSRAWADHFLVHDDNLGPYLCLGREALRPSGKAMSPRIVIGLFPREVAVTPIIAEQIATSALTENWGEFAEGGSGEWWDYMRQDEDPYFILRTLLVTRDSYVEHLKQANCHDGSCAGSHEVRVLENRLPDVFWMTEFSYPNLYVGNKSKLGEVLVDSQSKPLLRRPLDVPKSTIAIRTPSQLYLEVDRGAATFEILPLSLMSHCGLYRTKSDWNEW